MAIRTDFFKLFVENTSEIDVAVSDGAPVCVQQLSLRMAVCDGDEVAHRARLTEVLSQP